MSGKKQVFRPELSRRNSELMAWIFVVIIAASLFILRNTWERVPLWGWGFLIFLTLTAMSISLGNWVDRRTVLLLDQDGVAFENGLRKVRIGWDCIEKLQVIPAQWGQYVQVLGKEAHFEFRTLGEVEFQGQVRGRLGFSAGKEILMQILEKSGLSLVEKTDRGKYYYAR